MKNSKRYGLIRLLSLVLIAVLVTAGAACKKKDGEQETKNTSASIALGEGAKMFTFRVENGEGAETLYEIHTDETTVGAALLSLGLIQGDEGAYGLYVDTVNGEVHKFEVDGTYWAFYVNGEYGMTGCELTEISEGATYEFRVGK